MPGMDSAAVPTTGVRRVFGASLALSAVRCSLTYIVLPFIAPLVGFVTLSPVLAAALSAVAIAANLFAIRRVWAANHRWRWPYTAVCGGMAALLLVLLVQDLTAVAA
jgi:hypothetical protein